MASVKLPWAFDVKAQPTGSILWMLFHLKKNKQTKKENKTGSGWTLEITKKSQDCNLEQEIKQKQKGSGKTFHYCF